MALFNSKRGTIVGFMATPLFHIIFAVFVFVGLMFFIGGIKEKIIHEKRFLATDLALLADTVLSVKDNLDLIYYPARKTDKYHFDGNVSFSFKSNKVEVFTERPDDPHRGIYLFAPRKDMQFSEKAFKFDKSLIIPRFSKIGNAISIVNAGEEKKAFNVHKLTCPETKISFSRIVIDAGHGYKESDGDSVAGSDAGYVFNPNKVSVESESMLVNNLASHLPEDLSKELQFTRNVRFNDQGVISRDARIVNAQNADLVVSLHIGNHPKDFPLKIFYPYNSEESYNFACQMANSLSDKMISNNIHLTGVSLVPFNPDLILDFDEVHKNNPLQVVVQGKSGVLVELGSIVQFKALFDNLHIYANAVEEVLRNVKK